MVSLYWFLHNSVIWLFSNESSIFIIIKYLPSSKALLAFNTYPLFVSILAIILLKETVSYKEAACIIWAFSGIVIIWASKSTGKVIEVEHYIQFIALMMAVGSAIWSAIVSIFLRFFNKIYSPILYVFWFPMVLSSLIYMMYFINPNIFNVKYYTIYDMALLFMGGIMNILYHLFSGYSLRYEDASKLASYSYSGPVILLLFDIWLFEYSFTVLDILGSTIVIAFLLMKQYFGNN